MHPDMARADCYRACASIVLLRTASVCSAEEECSNALEVLLVHKPRKRDDWQLPQGGVEEGETTEQAALRELREETGLQAEIVGKSETCYTYDFPPSFRRFRPDNVCGQCIRFVFARLIGEQRVTVDGKEIDGFAWVLPEDVPRYIHRKPYVGIVADLIQQATALLP